MSWDRMRAIKTFEQFWEQCTQDERVIVDLLRTLILESGNLKEKISYGVPYYSANRRVFFLWPASAAFGPPEGVLFGFCEGYKMSDAYGFLEKGSRKQVFWITLRSIADVDLHILRDYVTQALAIDHDYTSLARRTRRT